MIVASVNYKNVALSGKYLKDKMKLGLDESWEGIDKTCTYYPCHKLDGQHCRWCVCPFYPCYDRSLGSWAKKEGISRVWNCSNCILPHRADISNILLKELREMIDGREVDDVPKHEYMSIFHRIKKGAIVLRE